MKANEKGSILTLVWVGRVQVEGVDVDELRDRAEEEGSVSRSSREVVGDGGVRVDNIEMSVGVDELTGVVVEGWCVGGGGGAC